MKEALTSQARLWTCGRGDVSTPIFGSHINPISTRGTDYGILQGGSGLQGLGLQCGSYLKTITHDDMIVLFCPKVSATSNMATGYILGLLPNQPLNKFH